MSDPVTQALVRLVEQCSTPEEMTDRVMKSFGEHKIPHARQIAAETKGFEWLRQGRERPLLEDTVSQDREPIAFVSGLRRIPSLVALLVGATTLVLVLLFPPFIIPLPQGMVSNAGFAFIFTPPKQGALTAVVNTHLLVLLVVGVIATTAAVYAVLLRIELLVVGNRSIG